MRKNIIISLCAAAAIGIGVWAAIFAALGNGGQQTIITSSDEETKTAGAAAETNWGLSFQQDGKAPAGNATSEFLSRYNAYYMDEKRAGDKVIYLTFDAGYENGYTEDILDVLKEEDVPAAFFVVGNYIEDNPQIVCRMEQEGHVVGNHTMTHPDMAAIKDEGSFRKELAGLEEAYKEATGKEMKKYYRPPQGKYSEENLKQACDMGYTTVFWSLAYVDWYVDDQPVREDALNILNRRIHPGAIVLLHSTSKTNARILQELIQGWKDQGYRFASLDGLTEQD